MVGSTWGNGGNGDIVGTVGTGADGRWHLWHWCDGGTGGYSGTVSQICHTLTEKLVAMTMGSGARVKSPASLGDIIVVAKRISPR